MIADKLASYRAAILNIMRDVEYCQHKGLNVRAENSHQLTAIMQCFGNYAAQNAAVT